MISRQKSLKKNFIMNIILTMSSFIFPLITFPYASRILLADGTGRVQFATSLVSYFILFSQLGIPTYGIKICASVRDDKEKLSRTVHELLIISFITMLISYTVLFFLLFSVPKFSSDRVLYVIISLNIFFTFIGLEWLYKALEQYTYITVRSIVFKLIALIAMFMLVHSKSDYIIYGSITILAASASNILNFINVHKYIILKPIGNYNIKQHLKPIFIFFAMSCAITVYTNLDNVMLGFMTSDADVGYYSVSVKIKNILVSIVTSLGAVLLPRVTYYIEHNEMNEFKRITKKAINFVILISVPMTIYFMIFAKKCIYFLSGSGYEGAIIPMIVIMPTLLLIGLTNIMGIQILVPLGKEKYVFYSVVAGALIDLILNTLLIPHMMSTGAAIGTLLAEVVVLIVQYIILKKDISLIIRDINYKIIFLSVILAVIGSVWVLLINFSSFISLLISSVCFFGIYVLILTLMKEPLLIEIEKQLLDKIKK